MKIDGKKSTMMGERLFIYLKDLPDSLLKCVYFLILLLSVKNATAQCPPPGDLVVEITTSDCINFELEISSTVGQWDGFTLALYAGNSNTCMIPILPSTNEIMPPFSPPVYVPGGSWNYGGPAPACDDNGTLRPILGNIGQTMLWLVDEAVAIQGFHELFTCSDTGLNVDFFEPLDLGCKVIDSIATSKQSGDFFKCGCTNVTGIIYYSDNTQYDFDFNVLVNCGQPYPPLACGPQNITIKGNSRTGMVTLQFEEFKKYVQGGCGNISYLSGVDITNQIDLPPQLDYACGSEFELELNFEDGLGNQITCTFIVTISCENSAIHLGTNADRILIRNDIHIGRVPFTIESWFKSENKLDNFGFEHRLFTLGGTTTNSRLEVGDDGGKLWIFTGQGPNGSITYNIDLRDTQWHHIALAYDGDTEHLYFDGNLIDDISDTDLDLRDLRVGYFPGTITENTKWKGPIDELRFWNYARSSEEITQSYSCIVDSSQPGLIGYWRFEEGICNENNTDIDTLVDEKGNFNAQLFDFLLQSDTTNFICANDLPVDSCLSNCQVTFNYFIDRCLQVNFQAIIEDFQKPDSVEFAWTSSDPNLQSQAQGFLYIFNGDTSAVEVCVTADDGNCSTQFCDTIQLQIPEPPTLSDCPNDITVYACEINLGYGSITAFDDCLMGSVPITFERSDGKEINEPYLLGQTDITISAIGIYGDTVICETQVSLLDTVPPTCLLKDTVLILDNNGTASLSSPELDIGSYDDCTQATFYQILLFSCDDVGSNLVDILVSDLSNNTDTCSATITIEQQDVNLRYITELVGCRQFVFIPVPDNFSEYFWTIDGQQYEERNPILTFSQNGSYEVYLRVTDQNGCIYEYVEAVRVDVDCDKCNARYIYTSDCYTAELESQLLEYGPNPGYVWSVNGSRVSDTQDLQYDFPGPGTYEVCVEISDILCRDTYCEMIQLDPIPPVFNNCPLNNVMLSVGSNCDPVFHSFNLEMASFCHSDALPIPDISYSRSDGMEISDPFELGSTVVRATFTDIYNVSSECLYTVEVMDDSPPQCNTQPITVFLDEDGGASITVDQVAANSTDNCGIQEAVLSKELFSCMDIGREIVNLQLNDGVNTSNCPIEITVIDSIRPRCRAGVTEVILDENGEAVLTIAELNATIEDNCTITAQQLEKSDFSCNDLGSSSITLLLSDGQNEMVRCNLPILVLDTIAPVCGNASGIVYLDKDGMGEVNLDEIQSSIVENCNEFEVQLFSETVNCMDLGAVDIKYIITDNSGNQTSCSANIQVIDTIPPKCEARDVVIPATSKNGAVIDFDVKVSDNCNLESVSYSHSSGELYPCGTYEVQIQATDESGNTNECEFKLEVIDCDACCISEQDFNELIKQGVSVAYLQNNNGLCLVQMFPPDMTDCQFITEINWGDGTVTRGMFPGTLEFLHEYLDTGSYLVCAVIEESDIGGCFSKVICKDIIVTESCEIITGVREVYSNQLVLFPNPVHHTLRVKSPIKWERYQIFSITGKLLQQGHNNESAIDVTELSAGIHFLRLKMVDHFVTKSFVKID